MWTQSVVQKLFFDFEIHQNCTSTADQVKESKKYFSIGKTADDKKKNSDSL